MKSCFFNLRLTLLLALFVALPMKSASSQDRYTEHCLELAKQADRTAIDHLLAKFQLTGALRRQDLSRALTNAKDAAEFARGISDSAYSKVANVQVELIRQMIDSRPAEDVDATLDLVGDIPELELHLVSAQLEAELWLGKSTANFEYLLKTYREAVKSSVDPYLVIQQKAIDLYVRVYRLDESPHSDEIIRRREELLKESIELDYQSGVAVARLLESSEFKFRKMPEQQIAAIENALTAATNGNDIILAIRCNEVRAIAHQLERQWDLARPYYVEAIKLAEILDSERVIMRVQTASMTHEMQSGQPAAAIKRQKSIESNIAYRRLTQLEQNSLHRLAVWNYGLQQDFKQVKAYKNMLLSSDEVKDLKKTQTQIAMAKARAVAWKQEAKDTKNNAVAEQHRLELEKAQLKDSHDRASARTEQILTFFRNYSLVATLLVLFLVPWFILVAFRSRLNAVSKELDSERETSHESKTKCEELAVRLNRLQRMESLGLMAGSVAHDFNNILVGVMGNAEVIQLRQKMEPESKNDEFLRQRVSSIIKSAEKAASLSRQMLAYAGKQYIARQSTDLNELIRHYETILQSACRENQELKLELSEHPLVSKVDVTQIEQVVLNLITNAVEASSDDGRITISTGFHSVDDIENDCSLYGTRKTGGDFCFIDVADSGSGISQLDMERIFEPFFSSSELGRGLGLSVVYGVIIGHDGFIKCSSNVGERTSFRVLLPVSIEPIHRNQPDPEDGFQTDNELQFESETRVAQKILVIDDEESVLDLCSQMLQINGWEVQTALGGKEGLRLATQFADEISCILVDVVMPEMGGSEVIRELDERGIQIPIVVMSGFSHTRLEFFLERPNVVSIVEKPFRVNQIKQAVQNAIESGRGVVTNAQLASDEHI